MDSVDRLVEIFKEFPGIGERQAKRFVYFLMQRNGDYSQKLSQNILELKKHIKQCSLCFRFFTDNRGGDKICSNCGDVNTDQSVLMVIEKDFDFESINKSKVFNGRYFILGGLVPIVEKNTRSKVRIEELKKILKENPPKEIILAFSISPQGDHTDFYVRNELQEMALELGIKISSMGRGLSTGTELEYSDNETIKNALKNRS